MFRIPIKLTATYWRDMFSRPMVQKRYRVKRSDGMYWAGPYRYQGVTFTNVDSLIYVFGSKESAQAAVKGCDLEHRTRLYTLTVERIE